MIIGHSEKEAAVQKLRILYQLTREQANEVVRLSEAMGWAPIPLVADEAAAAATNNLAFRWHLKYEVRVAVAGAIYRRVLGRDAEEHLAKMFNPDDSPDDFVEEPPTP